MRSRRALAALAVLPVLAMTGCGFFGGDDTDTSTTTMPVPPKTTDKDLAGFYLDVSKAMSKVTPKPSLTAERLTRKLGWDEPGSDYQVASFDPETQWFCVTATDGRYMATQSDMDTRLWAYLGEGECSTDEADAVVVGGAAGFWFFEWTKGQSYMRGVPGASEPSPEAPPEETGSTEPSAK